LSAAENRLVDFEIDVLFVAEEAEEEQRARLRPSVRFSRTLAICSTSRFLQPIDVPCETVVKDAVH